MLAVGAFEEALARLRVAAEAAPDDGCSGYTESELHDVARCMGEARAAARALIAEMERVPAKQGAAASAERERIRVLQLEFQRLVRIVQDGEQRQRQSQQPQPQPQRQRVTASARTAAPPRLPWESSLQGGARKASATRIELDSGSSDDDADSRPAAARERARLLGPGKSSGASLRATTGPGQAEVPGGDSAARMQQLLAEESSFNDMLVNERTESIRELNASIIDMNVLMREMAALVHQQGERINVIVDNVTEAADRTADAEAQLAQAAKHHAAVRRRTLCVVGILLAAVLVVALITGLAIAANNRS